jgi:hypothetical protein
MPDDLMDRIAQLEEELEGCRQLDAKVNHLIETRDEDRSERIRLERELRESHNHNARLIHFIINRSHIDMTFFDHYVKSHHPPGSRYALPRAIASESVSAEAVAPPTVVTETRASPPSVRAQKRADVCASRPVALKRRRLVDAATPAPQRTTSGSAEDIESDDDEDIGTAIPPHIPNAERTVH